ncbi:hypothetical protein FRB96_002508 [Tulasnella sp. 330]|nr:hypothetical protein FRB96_002508 [Tulasnella sp. 330]KAG8886674.1 hypothetical protein FRB98_001132 [Tulasnella sp. 332]
MAQTNNTAIAFAEIPIIDLIDSGNLDLNRRQKIAQEIRKACMEVGFFYVKNHGVPQSAIKGAIEQGKRFFAQPLDQKMLIDIHKVPNFKGYTALLAENTDPENRGDLHEGFDMGWEDPSGTRTDCASENDNGTRAMQGGNVWPTDLPGFKEPVLEYYHLLIKLGKTLFNLFALALDLPEDFFDDKCFTILWQDDVGGLQVLNTADEWIDAKPVPGTFVVKCVI